VDAAGRLGRAVSAPEPTAFLAAAERATNEYDVDAVMAVYAPDATLESVTDGAHELHRGADAVRRTWAGYLGGLGARGLTLRKHLVVADGETIVNEWQGEGRHRRARGIEVWRFTPAGAVIEHRLFTFLDTRPSEGPLARLRLAAVSPRTAMALLRAQRRARSAPDG
jgi:ketosteroid isomerase-like protein